MAFNTGRTATYVKDRYNLPPQDINADTIKGEVLYYFRYNRMHVDMCCTEFSDPYESSIEDIVVREMRKETDTIYHVIEVKISETDFKSEFWHKKNKHVNRGDGRFYDYFYFAVPLELYTIVNEHCEIDMLPYGIITVSFDDKKQLHTELKRRPEKLTRKENINEDTVNTALLKRMSSEVASTRCDIYKLKYGLAEVKRQIYYLSQSIHTS